MAWLPSSPAALLDCSSAASKGKSEVAVFFIGLSGSGFGCCFDSTTLRLLNEGRARAESDALSV
jgi:hypothetical protein